MQCVERGQVTLDEPIGRILPELADPEILKPKDVGADQMERPFTLTKAERKITLRHLLTHSSGLTYDIFDPTLMAWRASRGETPMGLSGKVIEAHSVPLLFEPGEGWLYSGGLDWAGVMVGRLNGNVTLEEYMVTNIFKPLGLKSTSFRLAEHPDIKSRLVECSARQEDGTLVKSPVPWPENAEEDAGGAGLYSSAPDYIKIIGDLIKDKPILLKKETVEEMLTPQFAEGSASLKGLLESKETVASMTGSEVTGGVNYGISGLLFTNDIGYMKKGTLAWGGLPNLIWFANRQYGVAALYASQVVPPGEPTSLELAGHFKQEIWRLVTSK